MEKSDILKTFKFGLLFTVLVVQLDFSIGLGMKQLYFSQKSGKFARLTTTIYGNSSEILIMGSSRANRHYVSEIFEKVLGQSTYNAGVQGQKLVFQRALQKIVLSRYFPKTIILNLDEEWLEYDQENYERLSDLNPYYWDFRNELEPVFSLGSSFVDLKLLPNTFRYNSTFLHILNYSIFPQRDFLGYRPLYGGVKVLKSKIPKKPSEKALDPILVTLFRDFIESAKREKINLVFVISPELYKKTLNNDSKSMLTMKMIAKDNEIPLFDFRNTEQFLRKKELFFDDIHLNDKGSRMFTEMTLDSLKSLDLNE
ncbi:hypothetical protein SAMN04489724_2623 [Algoriphagus locisalis]|uniref:SGNH/GDSL hydrolase family protein n=1 Tax=Algoriphagus locisalis TaxID=305507 RepID=A0A1I7BQY1_9BACT|nr:hypothetical protein [Algoriphagus locisalis]SFT89577.1 hypothetical protein SAMN04489724_2623 [Algoriphagus locisalis]